MSRTDKLRTDIRNVAVIAHVDHGKTTLVDAMLRQSGLLSGSGQQIDRVMDNVDLERERGITILAKNTALIWEGVKINILDTPGHHDFGGEVERMLRMADGVLLLVDAAEGPLPQTRFVLQKALALGLPVILTINKIDRKDARADEVLDEVYDLFIELDVSEGQLDFPILYTNGRAGIAHRELGDGSDDLRPLFETIVEVVPPPRDRREEPFVLHVNNLGWDDYVGRIVIGRIIAGEIRPGQPIHILSERGQATPGRVLKLYTWNGLSRVELKSAASGDIVSMAGIETISIGDTVAAAPDARRLPRIEVDEPTLAMNFCVNNGPYAGEDGKYVTSRNLRERLFREAKMNVAIRVEETDSADAYRVSGRGELQLSILVETMRREGYELMLSRPEVITRVIDGELCEPRERLLIDCPNEVLGPVSELLGPRKAQMLDMRTTTDRVRVTYLIPTRGLIGFHSDFLTETRGTGIMLTNFEGWISWQGPIAARRTGSIVADRVGTATPYALFHLQPRGVLFIGPSERVYEGMVIGEHARYNDIDVNPTKEKKLTNIRASGKDENVILSPPRRLSLEQAIEFISEDEFIEVTPKTFRIRKKTLKSNQRYKKASPKARP